MDMCYDILFSEVMKSKIVYGCKFICLIIFLKKCWFMRKTYMIILILLSYSKLFLFVKGRPCGIIKKYITPR